MTPSTPTTTGSPEGYVFQRDTMGRVRVPAARREALLDEFERGGTSGQAFAAMVGVKYSTFATWRQARLRATGARSPRPTTPAPATTPLSPSPTGAMRWLEAVALRLSLPGGACQELSQAHLGIHHEGVGERVTSKHFDILA